jgi:hypothetical protein
MRSVAFEREDFGKCYGYWDVCDMGCVSMVPGVGLGKNIRQTLCASTFLRISG